MRKHIYSLLLASLLGGGQLMAQSLVLPMPSPRAHFTQTVGLTDVNIDYSRPSVKERSIFGGLLPYDSLWRTGANTATVIEFSDDVTIEGQKLAKGKYALFTIPGKNEWTVIFNKNTNQAGTDQYKKSDDALRLKVKPHSSDFTETLTISLDSLRDNSAKLIIDWERIVVPMNIQFPTTERALDNITKSTSGISMNYARGANYYVENNLDLTTALELVNKSIALENTYYNNWVKAQILAKQGNYAEAANLAEKAVELGKAAGADSPYRFYSARIEKMAKEYREKAGPAPKSKKKK